MEPGAPDVRELAVGLLVASARFTRLAARETLSPIPHALWRALAQLEELGPLRVSELAAVDRVSQPTATTLVRKLVERGWARRTSDLDDARAVQVTITAGGRRALVQNREAAADALAPRLHRLDEQSLRTLTAGVHALRQVLEADPPADPPAEVPTDAPADALAAAPADVSTILEDESA